jgi:hypothetical protein
MVYAQAPVSTPAPVVAPAPKKYPKLYIVSDVDLIGLTWTDLVLEKSSSFTNVLITAWIKWAGDKIPAAVGEVVPCQGTCSDDFYRWLQIPQEQNMEVPAEYQNSLWLKISYTLQRLNYVAEINEWSFTWEGSVVLLESNSKRSLATFTIHPETKTWRGLEQKALNSRLASYMYKSALDYMNKSMAQVKESEASPRLTRLIVQGQSSVNDVLSLMELLKKEGSSLSLTTKLDVFGPKEAQLICFYQGEEKSFIDLLSRLKELKSTQSYSLVNEFTGVHHVLKLVAP